MSEMQVGRIEFGPARIMERLGDDLIRDARIAALELQVKQLTAALLAMMEAHRTLLQTLTLASAERKPGEQTQ